MPLNLNHQFSMLTTRLIFVICALGVLAYSAPANKDLSDSVMAYRPFPFGNRFDELDRYFEPDERIIDNRKREFFELEQGVMDDENTKIKRNVFSRINFRPAKRSATNGRSGFRPAKRSATNARSGFRPA